MHVHTAAAAAAAAAIAAAAAAAADAAAACTDHQAPCMICCMPATVDDVSALCGTPGGARGLPQ